MSLDSRSPKRYPHHPRRVGPGKRLVECTSLPHPGRDVTTFAGGCIRLRSVALETYTQRNGSQYPPGVAEVLVSADHLLVRRHEPAAGAARYGKGGRALGRVGASGHRTPPPGLFPQCSSSTRKPGRNSCRWWRSWRQDPKISKRYRMQVSLHPSRCPPVSAAGSDSYELRCP